MYKHIEYRNGKCEAYRDEIPVQFKWEANAVFKIRLSEWQATKEIFEFAEGELNKFSKNFKTALILIDEQTRLGNDPGPYNITPFVKIKDGLAYFLEPGKEEENQDKIWKEFYILLHQGGSFKKIESKFTITRKK